MTRHIFLADRDGNKYTSSGLSTRDDALSFARDWTRAGDLLVLKIADERGDKIDMQTAGVIFVEENGEGPAFISLTPGS